MKLIRLSTGEEIIGRVEFEGDEINSVVTVSDPILLLPAGEGKLGMTHFMPYGKSKNISINPAHVMFITEPNEDLERQVVRMTSGIELPSIIS